jgi:simple sugar transport system permease protein
MATTAVTAAPSSSLGRSLAGLGRAMLPPLLALVAALSVGALLLLLTGFDPVQAYAAMWEGIVGSTRNVGEALLRATPLILIGTGIAIAFRCGIWNIGAEGQLYMGAAAGTAVGLTAGALSPWISVPLALVAGMVAGGLWAAIAGWLKVRLQLNEVVTTIMLNYIAIGLISWLVTGPMQEASGYNPQTDEIAASMVLVRIFPPTRLHLGFLFAVAVAILAGILLFRTHWGYALRAVGANPTAALYAGINVNRQFVLAMFLSGACAGIAGAVEILGVIGRMYETIGAGYGFTGIAVSLLVGNNPFGVIFSGILFGALSTGSELMQLTAKIPSVMTFILQGLIIAFLVSFQAVAKRRRLRA